MTSPLALRRASSLLLLVPLLATASLAAPEKGTPSPLPKVGTRVEARDHFYRRALVYLERCRRDDMAQAIWLLLEAKKVDPGFAPVRAALAQGRALRYLWGWERDPRELERALDEGERAVALDPKLSESHLGLGLASVAADRYSRALEELDRALALDPASFRAHLFRGFVLRGLRRLREARAELTRVLELEPSSPLAYSLLGDYYQDLRDYSAAERAYIRSIELDSRLLWPRLGLAAAFQKNADYKRAAETYSSAQNDFPGDSDWCRILAASLLVSLQRYDEALQIYEAVPDEQNLGPPLRRRLLQVGRAYSLEKLGRSEAAEYYWNQAVSGVSPDFDGSIREREVISTAYEALVRYHEGRGGKKRAEQLLQEACSRSGMSFNLYGDLAERQARTGRLAESAATLRHGLGGAPEDLDLVSATQILLPIIRLLAGNKTGRTVQEDADRILSGLATRLSDSEPPSYVPYLNQARAEALLGHPGEALEHLRQALEKGYSGVGGLSKDPDLKALSREPGFKELTGGS